MLMLFISKIYDSLKDWPKVLSTFCNLHSKHSPDSADGSFALLKPTHTGIQKQFLAGINCFAAVCRSRERVSYNKIVGNLLVLATCLWWFQMVCHLIFPP